MALIIKKGSIKSTLSPSKLKKATAEIEESRALSKQARAQLLEFIAKGDVAGQQEAQKLMLSDPKLILSSADSANRKIKPAKRQPLEVCFYVATSIQLGEPLTEEVLVHSQKKKSGDYRPICEFGLWHRTRHELVLRVMECHLQPRPFQYTLKGVASAIRAVKQAVGSGYIHLARLDIKSFFESFRIEKLSPILPLSPEVVEHAVFGRHMRAKGAYRRAHYTSYSSWATLLAQARRGLPQGAACSPIIGVFCLSHLKWSMTKGVLLINYADDFLLLAKTQELLEAAMGELIQAMAELPGGHFVPTIMDQSSAYKGIRFLGHRVQILNGIVKTTVSRETAAASYSEWCELDDRVGQHGLIVGKTNLAKAKELLARMWAFAEGWQAAFKECDNVDEYLGCFMDHISDYVYQLKFDIDEIVSLVDDSMKYHPDAYTLGK
jgi:hypothetical protein